MFSQIFAGDSKLAKTRLKLILAHFKSSSRDTFEISHECETEASMASYRNVQSTKVFCYVFLSWPHKPDSLNNQTDGKISGIFRRRRTTMMLEWIWPVWLQWRRFFFFIQNVIFSLTAIIDTRNGKFTAMRRMNDCWSIRKDDRVESLIENCAPPGVCPLDGRKKISGKLTRRVSRLPCSLNRTSDNLKQGTIKFRRSQRWSNFQQFDRVSSNKFNFSSHGCLHNSLARWTNINLHNGIDAAFECNHKSSSGARICDWCRQVDGKVLLWNIYVDHAIIKVIRLNRVVTAFHLPTIGRIATRGIGAELLSNHSREGDFVVFLRTDARTSDSVMIESLNYF